MTFSKNGVALIILIASLLGVEGLEENMVVEFFSAIGTVVSLVLMVWNQLARKDTVGFLFKK